MVKKVNQVFYQVVSGCMNGIMDMIIDLIVGMDIIGYLVSSIVDLSCIVMIGVDLVKVIVWYDNEWGYVNCCVDLVRIVVCLCVSYFM